MDFLFYACFRVYVIWKDFSYFRTHVAFCNGVQLSSCFLICMKDDSIEGIYDTLKECAVISKSAGGIGVSVHNIRATGSYIRGTNGTSNGIVPMLRVFNDTARYVDQGGGKRKGLHLILLFYCHISYISIAFWYSFTFYDNNRCFCCVSGAMACWYLWVSWFEEKPWKGIIWDYLVEIYLYSLVYFYG